MILYNNLGFYEGQRAVSGRGWTFHCS